MKIRKGLVSNSSSSSFMLATPKEMTREELSQALGLNLNSPFGSMFEDLLDLLMRAEIVSEKEYLKDHHCCDSWEEIINDYGEELPEWLQRYKNVYDKGWVVKIGTASDDSYDIEAGLRHTEIEYESDELVFINEA